MVKRIRFEYIKLWRERCMCTCIIWCARAIPLFHRICHYFHRTRLRTLSYVSNRVWDRNIHIFLHFAFNISFPIRRLGSFNMKGYHILPWLRTAVLLFSCVTKARKCRDDCYWAISIRNSFFIRSLRAFDLQKGATKEIPPWRMGIAGGAYVPIERTTYWVQQIIKRFQSGWILSFFYSGHLIASILCGMSNEKYFSVRDYLYCSLKIAKSILY